MSDDENKAEIKNLVLDMLERDLDRATARITALETLVAEKQEEIAKLSAPIPMRLTCPICGALHVDEGEFATKPHHTHACQNCGMVWRPAVSPTVGTQFLPGFRNEEK